MIVPMLLAGIAAAVADPGGSGGFVVADGTGDQVGGHGAGTDIVRVGAYDDGSNAWFTVKVNTPGVPPNPNDQIQIAVNFTTPDGTRWSARGIWNTDGTVTNSGVYSRDANIGHATDGGAGAAWNGNELVIHVPNIDMAPNYTPGPGDVWTDINAWAGDWLSVADPPTAQQYYDATSTATYTIGSANSGTTTSGGPATAPSVPSGLAATAGNTVVTLGWIAPANGGSPITSYSIYRGSSSGSETLLVATGTAATAYTDTGLTNGNTYYYKIAATNAVGTSALSTEVSATPVLPTVSALGFTLYAGPNGLVDHVGEGGIGVNWNTGNVMFSGNGGALCCLPGKQKEVRVIFNDATTPATATWTEVTPPYPNANIDPLLFTDSVTGRTFAGGDNTYCTRADWTDDDGTTWVMGNACSTTVDHETIGGGPFADPLHQVNPLYPHTVYHCEWILAADFVVTGAGFGPETLCVTSWDGGVTYNPETLLPCSTEMVGHVRVGPDGTAYVPTRNCQNGVAGGSISRDDGLTWTQFLVPLNTPSRDKTSDPSVSAGRGDKFDGGRVYYALTDSTLAMKVTTSTDHGATWTTPVDLSTPLGVKSTAFAETIAGDDDRAAVEWLGTKDAGNAFANGFAGTWHAYMSVTYDGGATWSTIDMTPNDPVQRNCIWQQGGSNACRNLLDFNDITMDATGRILGEFADGCVPTNGCSLPSGTSSQSTYSWGTIARQSSGRGLLAAYDTTGPGPLAVTAGGPYTGLVSNAIGLVGSASAGTAPYTYAWTVASAPSGSNGGSFSNAGSATTSFTPDVAGLYTLTLTAHDAASGVASANAVLTANNPQTSGCSPGGVTIASDASNDISENGGGAGEIFCLRGLDTGTTIEFFVDTKGKDVNGGIMVYDVLFSDKALAGDQGPGEDPVFGIGTQQFEVEATWDGSQITQTGLYNAYTGANMQGNVDAQWEGNTLHITWQRDGKIENPANGDTLVKMGVHAAHCVPDCTTGSFDVDDAAPNAMDASYAVGGSSSSGGSYYPECGESLGTDAAGDDVGPATPPPGEPTSDSHDLLKFAMSDDDANVKFCWTVADIHATTANEESFTDFFSAPYQAPGVAYSLTFALNADGTPDVDNSQAAQGACDPADSVGCGTLLSVPVQDLKVVGNTAIMTLAKADIGSPADGSSSGVHQVDTRDLSDNNGVQPYDRFNGQAFTFGKRLNDVSAPSQVVGVTVVDPQSGSTLDLAWNAATDDHGVTQYDVMRSTTSGSGYVTVGTPAGTSFTDSGLTTGTTYYYVVKAEDAAGNQGPASVEVSGTPTTNVDTTPPTTPTGLAACGATASLICIQWAASTDASGIANYRVFRDGSFLGTSTTTSYTDTNVAPSTTYSYTVSAVDTVGNEGAQSDAISVSTLGFGNPTISITTPATGSSTLAPITLAGTYSTTGEPSAPQGAQKLDPALPWETKEWLSSPFVFTALHSPEYTQLHDQLVGVQGYLVAFPTASGKIQVLLSGAKPSNAPTQSPTSHWPIVYQPNVQLAPLIAKTAAQPQRVVTLADVRAGNAPTGPIQPGTEFGIGPGTAIMMHDPVNGGTYICTASFLFENPATGRYYLETAGHCLLDADTAQDSIASPNAVMDKIFLCYDACTNNFLGLGTYFEIDRTPTFNPVAYAHQAGEGEDVGIIAIPPELNSYLRPWEFLWSGPTSTPTDQPTLGDLEVHYGHGAASGPAYPTQGRAAVSLGPNGDIVASGQPGHVITQVGYIYGGDSGSAIEFGAPDMDRLVSGGAATGIITHELGTGVCTPSIPSVGSLGCVDTPGNIFFATDFTHALDMVEPKLGFRPVLVTQDAEIRLPGQVALAATITSPSTGATYDVGTSVTVTGTATFPMAVSPGTGSATYYAAQDSCNTNLRLEAAPSALQSYCAYTFSPIAPAFDQLGGIVAQYTSAGVTQTLPIDTTRPITASVWVNQPAANAYTDIEVQILDGSTLIGSSRATETLAAPTGGATELTFSFPALVSVLPEGHSVSMKVLTHEAQEGGPSVGGATPTRFTLPLGTFPTNTVELSVDDATFSASHAVATTNGASWSAIVPAADLPIGSHTLYARATQGAAHSPVSSAGVTIVSGIHTPPTASFTQAFDLLTGSFTDTSTAGDSPIVSSAWNFGDGATATGTSAAHTYAAAGTYTVTLVVTDANGLTGSTAHTVTASDTHVWSVDVRITDGSGGIVLDHTSAGDVADGAGTWSYFWNAQPTPGTYTLEASLLEDGAPAATTTSTFTVLTSDRAPVIDATGPQSVQQADTLVFQVTGSDPDGDALTWSMVSGPAGSAFDADTQTFTWPTTFNDLGAYSVTVSATDGTLTTTQTIPVTVILTPRAPSVAAASLTVVERHAGSVLVTATTLNHDVVSLTAAGLPAGATFTDLGNNKARITWTPGLGTTGDHLVTVTATSYGLTSDGTVTIHVLQDSAFTLTVPASAAVTSPGKSVDLTATIKNTGPETDTFHFAASIATGWTITTPADVTLAPGESQTLTLTATAPTNAISALPTLQATSLGNPNVKHSVSWSISVPLEVAIAMDPAAVGKDVNATITITFHDGTPVAGAQVIVTQTPDLTGVGTIDGQLASTKSGTTGADGAFHLTFSDANAKLPGTHKVNVRVSYNGRAASANATYTVGPSPPSP